MRSTTCPLRIRRSSSVACFLPASGLHGCGTYHKVYRKSLRPSVGAPSLRRMLWVEPHRDLDMLLGCLARGDTATAPCTVGICREWTRDLVKKDNRRGFECGCSGEVEPGLESASAASSWKRVLLPLSLDGLPVLLRVFVSPDAGVSRTQTGVPTSMPTQSRPAACLVEFSVQTTAWARLCVPCQTHEPRHGVVGVSAAG